MGRRVPVPCRWSAAGRRSRRHDPERRSRSCGCCCVPVFLWLLWGADELARGGVAARGARRDRLGRRLHRPALRPGQRARQDPRPDSPIASCCVAAAIALLTEDLPHRGQRGPVDRARSARCSSRSATVALGAGGRAPHRRRVGRQGGHARADVRAADVPRSPTRSTSVACVLHRRRLGLRDRRHHSRVLRRGEVRSRGARRAARGPCGAHSSRRLQHEGGDPGRRRRHPTCDR